jgi:hypothetical protein
MAPLATGRFSLRRVHIPGHARFSAMTSLYFLEYGVVLDPIIGVSRSRLIRVALRIPISTVGKTAFS